MLRPSNQKILTIKSVLLKSLVVFSLIALTSCNLFSSRLTQDQQQPSKTSSSGQTQDQIGPASTSITQMEPGGIIEGELSKIQYEAAINLVNIVPGEGEVYAVKGVVNSIITGSSDIKGETAEDRVSAYFTQNAALYQITNFSQTFQLVDKFEQPNGAQILQYAQIINNIPVYQADIRVTLDAQGNIAMVNSNYMPDTLLPESLEPKMNPTSAKAAIQALGFVLLEDHTPTLAIYSPAMVGKDGQPFLAWFAKAAWDGGGWKCSH